MPRDRASTLMGHRTRWQQRTETHWLRGLKAYGGPPPCAFTATLWWPLSDPKPGRDAGWWT